MSIPLRVPDIEIPDDDPFRHDLLDRKKTAETLTDVVRSFQGPGVIAVDAAWGTGKTTFLKMWVQHLRNGKFTVVEFNAWETDFATDPFLALSTELQNGLGETGTSSDAMANFKKWSKRVLQHGIPDIVRLVSSGVPLLGDASGKLTKSVIKTFTESRVSSYGQKKDAMSKFQDALQAIAAEITRDPESPPLVVVIDELDRCRPTYAVELLETAKHLFSVPHVVFVLAINRRELVHSVRSLYGSAFDADTYLRRFIDAEIHLPNPDLGKLTESALRTVGLDVLGTRIPDDRELANARGFLVDMLKMSSAASRTVLQNLHVLGLVLGSTRDRYYALPFAASVATVLRIHDEGIFSDLTRGNATDEEAISAVRKRCEERAWNSSFYSGLFESAIMTIVKHQTSAEKLESMTPLFGRYQKMMNTSPTTEVPSRASGEHRRMQRILEDVERMEFSTGVKNMTFFGEFQLAVARLEALSGASG